MQLIHQPHRADFARSRVGRPWHDVAMCGRFAIDDSVDELVRAFVAEGGDWADALTALPNPEIRPTDTIAVLLESAKGADAPRRILAPARWSLVPSWSRTLKTSGPTFNARVETVGEKATWKGPLAKRRCVIPASSYAEWRGDRGATTRFDIANPEGELMLFAGLAQWWRPSESAPWLLTATMITRPALGTLAEIHDRMPMVLPPGLVDDWIDAQRSGDQACADATAAASTDAGQEPRAIEATPAT